MSEVYRFHAGDSPLLISVPHDGRKLPPEIAAVMTPAGRDLPDTDWHVARLYAFARDMCASLLIAENSRYVVDLNRPPDDGDLYPGQLRTGICPTETFAGDALYADTYAVTNEERRQRIDAYWRPYHDRLRRSIDEIRQKHGAAFLWDAHSIPSRVPRLFDGELPALNIGTDNTRSCPQNIEQAVADVARGSSYSTVVNARFRGGYITRHYGDPDAGCFALQLELAQRCYMDEASTSYDQELAAAVTPTLRSMLEAFTTAGRAARAGAPEAPF
jgi:N-formylglutamate amidohydrolase